jgi:hypothetical protein
MRDNLLPVFRREQRYQNEDLCQYTLPISHQRVFLESIPVSGKLMFLIKVKV